MSSDAVARMPCSAASAVAAGGQRPNLLDQRAWRTMHPCLYVSQEHKEQSDQRPNFHCIVFKAESATDEQGFFGFATVAFSAVVGGM